MWKDELIKNLFSSDPSEINTKKAINLKYKNTPSSLYRYRPFDKNRHSLELLETDKIYLSKPAEYNDPFDCGLILTTKDLSEDFIKEVIVESTFNDLKKISKCSTKEKVKLKRSKDIRNDLPKFVVKKTRPNISPEERPKYIEIEKRMFTEGFYLDPGFSQNIYVGCFSETNKSILMWSHYANNHEGLCIEYNFKELGLSNFFSRFIFPVIYKSNIFNMNDYLPDSKKDFGNVFKNYIDGIKIDDFLDRITVPEVNGELNNMALFYNALVKYEDWKYEKEWRYVFPYNDPENKKMYLPVPKPKAIYLGAKTSKENFKKILKIGKDRDINVYKMEIKPNEFGLEAKLIHSVH